MCRAWQHWWQPCVARPQRQLMSEMQQRSGSGQHKRRASMLPPGTGMSATMIKQLASFQYPPQLDAAALAASTLYQVPVSYVLCMSHCRLELLASSDGRTMISLLGCLGVSQDTAGARSAEPGA